MLAVFALAAVPARANNDAVQFGSDIYVAPGSSIHDAVCFFCSVNAQGSVDHDIVVFFGNVHIAGRSNHDVVNFFGNVRVDNDGIIAHDLVSFFGGVRLGDSVSVGNDMVVMFGSVRASNSAIIAGNRVFQPVWVLLIPFLILGGIIYAIVIGVRSFRSRRLYAAYPFPPPPPPPAPASSVGPHQP